MEPNFNQVGPVISFARETWPRQQHKSDRQNNNKPQGNTDNSINDKTANNFSIK